MKRSERQRLAAIWERANELMRTGQVHGDWGWGAAYMLAACQIDREAAEAAPAAAPAPAQPTEAAAEIVAEEQSPEEPPITVNALRPYDHLFGVGRITEDTALAEPEADRLFIEPLAGGHPRIAIQTVVEVGELKLAVTFYDTSISDVVNILERQRQTQCQKRKPASTPQPRARHSGQRTSTKRSTKTANKAATTAKTS